MRSELTAFLIRRRIRSVFVAGDGAGSPPLAYMTGFPRLSITLSGRHPMRIPLSHGEVQLIRPGPGEAVLVPPNHWNFPEWSEPGKVLTLLLGTRQVGMSLAKHDGGGSEPLARAKAALPRPLDEVSNNLVGALAGLSDPGGPPRLRCLVVEALLGALAVQLEQPGNRHHSKARGTYEAMCLYIHENSHQPLSRDAIAEHFELNPSHVSRLFRSEGGVRFSDYLNRVRVRRAQVLLQRGRLSLKEVAIRCGYRDAAYFCRVFRRFARMTPTDYRAQVGAAE